MYSTCGGRMHSHAITSARMHIARTNPRTPGSCGPITCTQARLHARTHLHIVTRTHASLARSAHEGAKEGATSCNHSLMVCSIHIIVYSLTIGNLHMRFDEHSAGSSLCVSTKSFSHPVFGPVTTLRPFDAHKVRHPHSLTIYQRRL